MTKIQSICKISTICFLGALFLGTPLNAQTKIACVGNSITQFYHYTDSLQNLLTRGGISATVRNEGVTTTTMLKPAYSNCSYWTNGKLSDVFTFKPDVITIMLGTNDAKQGTDVGTGCGSSACINNWKNKAQFTPAYNSMIDTIYSTLGYKPRIFCVFPPPAQASNCCCIFDTSFTKEMIPMIQQVAADRGLATINCHQTSYKSNPGSSDGVHPTAEGVDSLGHWFYRGLTTVRMLPYPAALSFTVRRGQTDTTGTTRLDSVSNAAITGTLDSITVSNKATWLQCKAAGTPRNSQKVRNTIALTMLPAAAGTYYDTITVSATNASHATGQYIVTLTLQPSVDVKGDIYASSGLGPDVRFVNSHEILVTTFKPGLHDVFLYTISGKTAASTKVNGAGTSSFHAPAGPSAVYIVRVKSNGSGEIDKVLVNLGK